MINIWTIASMTGQGGSACAQNDVCTIRDLLAVVITCDFRGGGEQLSLQLLDPF